MNLQSLFGLSLEVGADAVVASRTTILRPEAGAAGRRRRLPG